MDAPVGKAHLCLDHLSQLKEGKVAFNSPKPGLQHGLNSIIVQERAQALPDIKQCLIHLNCIQGAEQHMTSGH